MIQIRPGRERGHFDHGWLDTYHTFSFADYHDPEHTQFRALRVINEDRVRPGHGFGTHHHRDMEIISYVLEGSLEHKDSLGNGSVIRAGELQRITAGRGILHSEFNPSRTDPVHFYQIWLFPRERGLEPSYEQRFFPPEGRRGRWQTVASPDGRDGSLKIHQEAGLHLAILEEGGELAYDLQDSHHAWLQVTRGQVHVNGRRLAAGDGAALSDEPAVTVQADGPAEVMLFDLA